MSCKPGPTIRSADTLFWQLSIDYNRFPIYNLHMPWTFKLVRHISHPVKWGWGRTDDFVRTQISWMHRKPNFLILGTPLGALCARQSSAPFMGPNCEPIGLGNYTMYKSRKNKVKNEMYKKIIINYNNLKWRSILTESKSKIQNVEVVFMD